jgi:hypothetical protein
LGYGSSERAMQAEVILAVGVLVAITLWLAIKHAFATQQMSRQREIAQRGSICQGRVVAIQRPFLLDNCTRLYFDFAPDGQEEVVRGCHIDRRETDEVRASLPAQGTLVTVRYLPNRPRQAVIGKLVS